MFQAQGIAGTQGKHFVCLGGKPGLSELSESLATAASWISSPRNIPLPAQPFPDPPEELHKPTPAVWHYLCCSP